MSDYTPTTKDVREAWWYAASGGGLDPDFDNIYYPAFDRWFAEELRKAKEEAWKEGMNYAMPPDAVLLYSDNPYRKTD